MGTQNNYLFGGDNRPVQASIGAPTTADLTWEKAIHYNAGIDIVTLRNRLSLTADVYIRDTKDMLGRVLHYRLYMVLLLQEQTQPILELKVMSLI